MPIRVSRSFKDISLSFVKHPVTNDVIVIKNEDAIKKSVMNLVRTSLGERFFQPLVGTSVYNSLFELATPEVSIVVQQEIENILLNNEPRIKTQRVQVDIPADSNDLNIKIEYLITGLGLPRQEIEFVLQSARM